MTISADEVRAIGAQMALVGPAFYFTPETLAVGRQHGLDGFRFYIYGRGGVLGDVEPAVVTSAFGYFSAATIDRMWTTARERSDLNPREAGRAYMACAQDFGRRTYADLPQLDAFCAAAGKVVAAANPAALALFAGVAAEPLAADLPARAQQLVTVLREFRGSAHLVAVLGSGLDPKRAHGVKRPTFWKPFGYDEAELPQETEADRVGAAAAEELTDQLVLPAFSVLTGSEVAVLSSTLGAMVELVGKASPAASG
ncbi:MAG TPA: hypothetical protein VHC41_11650 [Mycobacteriales bacterium]|nr:hypothetical protein [Mycobacteriales bacterium]